MSGSEPVLVNMRIAGVHKRVDLGPKYTAYPREPPFVQNLCGAFVNRIYTNGLESVIMRTRTCFGLSKTLFHIDGNVTINDGKANFMGARSFRGIQRLGASLNLPSSQNHTHMAVVTLRLGKCCHCDHYGYLEHSVMHSHYRFAVGFALVYRFGALLG